MKYLVWLFISLIGTVSFAGVKTDCFKGKVESCKSVMREYGRTSDRADAVKFFSKACASESLNVLCEIITVEKEKTVAKTMQLYAEAKDSPFFTIDGKKATKIYRIKMTK